MSRYEKLRDNALGITVGDPVRGFWYKPNLDENDSSQFNKSWEVMSLYNKMNNDIKFLIRVCHEFGLDERKNIHVLRSQVYHKIITEGENIFTDRFIQLAKEWHNDIDTNKLNDEVQRYGYISDNVNTGNISVNENVGNIVDRNESHGMRPKIKFAHMIKNILSVRYRLEQQVGINWPVTIYAALQTTNVFFVSKDYACELLDKETLLIYDRNYKPETKEQEPFWHEEDLVRSQLHWHEKKTIFQFIGNLLYRVLWPGMVIGRGLAGHDH